jgi:adenylate kinase family enzyme
MIEGVERILVLGHCGAGKSTLAVQLGEMLDLPVIHLDQLSWRPGWQEEDRAVFADRLRAAAAGERWIIEGNYTSWLDLRLPRAQAAVWLDYPLWLCLWRIVRRVRAWRGRVRPDMAPGCPEKLDWEFVRWAVTHHRTARRRVAGALAGAPHVKAVRLRSPGQTGSFLRGLSDL